ncbi:unnamed protein product [Citrullus colocynthis]|uniref:Uncharacterized protein n=1 Tax=Citrullus colocynthis TaxID=252529 RepID=A0ABP0YXC5_9ROSI
MFRSICSLLFKKSTAGLPCSDSTVVQEIFHQLPDPPQLPDLLPLTRSSNSSPVAFSSANLSHLSFFVGNPGIDPPIRADPTRSTRA